ncbi:MAG TPA: hypothetical protein VKR79_07470 [Gaiellaceae bacterium]|nr:hypothetical protein [Gaiellaceae bacterium]
MRNKLVVAALILAIGSIAGLAGSANASAASGGVYVVTPTWWGWCPGSTVTAVYYINQSTGASGGDAGDDIVWVPVHLNTANELTVTVKCRAAWESSATYTFIRPTRTDQAWFIGAGGETWHN